MEYIFAGLLVLAALFFYFRNTSRSTDAYQIIAGIVEVIGVNWLMAALFLFLLAFVPPIAYPALWSISALGIWQLVYVVPRSISLKRQRNWARLKGVIAAAVLVALLNGSCWILMGSGGLF